MESLSKSTMNKKSKTILFFGNERLATGVSTTVPVLRALIDNGYNIAGVVVAQDDNGASRKNRELEIASVAATHNIPLLSFSRLADASDHLKSFHATAAVLVAYGKLIPSLIIDLFPHGIINLHPSLLPKHRGPTPLESTLLDGDSKTGVTLMQLATKMDAGPIYTQEVVSLEGNETKQALADQLSTVGMQMIITSLPLILDGTLKSRPQDDKNATYDKLIAKSAGTLSGADWDQPAETLERQVRAYAGWPRSRTTIGHTDVIITSAHTEPGNGQAGSLWLGENQLGIYGSDGVLIIDTLIPAGKREMPTRAFLAGYKL
jgi:methionyl-tRNA formyltransferase